MVQIDNIPADPLGIAHPPPLLIPLNPVPPNPVPLNPVPPWVPHTHTNPVVIHTLWQTWEEQATWDRKSCLDYA